MDRNTAYELSIMTLYIGFLVFFSAFTIAYFTSSKTFTLAIDFLGEANIELVLLGSALAYFLYQVKTNPLFSAKLRQTIAIITIAFILVIPGFIKVSG